MDFIYCVWAFNKNYEQKIDNRDDEESQDSEFDVSDSDSDDEKPIKQPDKYYTYTFDQLMKLIL